MNFIDYLKKETSLHPGMHILMHGSMRSIRHAFPGLTAEKLLSSIQEVLTPSGSLVMPVFTYCFVEPGKKEVFDPAVSISKVGAISEVFRKMPLVTRTASPTHSFALWGKVSTFIDENNNPQSPLGKNSVLDWLANTKNSHILGLGTDFTSFTFGHYLETLTPVPWHNTFCWNYLNVKPIANSIHGKYKLVQAPGCSKSFINFENYLRSHKVLKELRQPMEKGYFIPVAAIIKEGLPYFQKKAYNLLCPMGTCQACDERWLAHLDEINTLIKRDQ